MKIPRTIDDLLRHPETRAERLRDADIHFMVSAYFTTQKAATAVYIKSASVLIFQDGKCIHETVESADWAEIEAFLAHDVKPERYNDGEDGEADEDDEKEGATAHE